MNEIQREKLELIRKRADYKPSEATLKNVIEIPQIDELALAQDENTEKIMAKFDDVKKAVSDIEIPEQDNSDIIKAIDGLATSLYEYTKATKEEAIKQIEVIKSIKPVVNVEQPKEKISYSNPYDTYRPADTQEGSGNRYYGYLDPVGKWFIVRVGGKDSKQYRYASGAKDYENNWRKRTAQDYKRYNEVSFK